MRLRKFVSFTAAFAVALSGLVFAGAPAQAAPGDITYTTGGGTVEDGTGNADFNGASGNKGLDITTASWTITPTTLNVTMNLVGSPAATGAGGGAISMHWLVGIYTNGVPVGTAGVDGVENSTYVADAAAASPTFPGTGTFAIGANSMSFQINLASLCPVVVGCAAAGGAAAFFALPSTQFYFATSSANGLNGAKDVAPNSGPFAINPGPSIVSPAPTSPGSAPFAFGLRVLEGTTAIQTWTANAASQWTISNVSPGGSVTSSCATPSVSCVVSLAGPAVLGVTYVFTITASYPGDTNPARVSTQIVTVNVDPIGTPPCTVNCVLLAPNLKFTPTEQIVKEGQPVSSVITTDGRIYTYSAITCTPNTGVTGKIDAVTGLPTVSGTPTANGECKVTATGPGGSSTAYFYYYVLPILKLTCGATGTVSSTVGITPGNLTVSGAPSGGRIEVASLGKGLAKATLEAFAGGRLTYQAAPGFSGNSSVTLKGSLNGDDVNCVAPVIVNPEPAFGGYYSLTGSLNTNITWVASQNAIGYVVTANGAEVCRTTAETVICDVKRILGPNDQVTIQALGNDGTKSTIIPAAYKVGEWVYAGTINFASGQSTLNAAGVKQAQKVLALLQRAGFTNVRAVGNTDGQGGSKGAVALSKARVARVTAWMTSRADVTITGEFDGNLFPVATNATKAGQAKNRRVDIWVR